MEIDYIEEYDGKLYAYEFKWDPAKKVLFSKTFLNACPGSETTVVTKTNIMDFMEG
jgi:uncharacterized protein